MTTRRKVLSLAMCALASAMATAPAAAQSYPNRTIKIIAPFPPGGPTDAMARMVAQHISTRLGQPVIVESRPGAGGTIGSKAAASAEPDGYTLLWVTSGTMAIAPELYKKLDYDTKAFVPVALIAKLPHVFVVRPDIPANTVAEFVTYAKANPGKLSYGGPLGTAPHLMGTMFAQKSGINTVFIPYKGAAPAITDLLGGQTQFTFDALMALSSLVSEGKLRILAIASAKRWPALPNTPTMIESGYPDFPTDTWSGVVAPAGTPAAIVDKLNAAINEGMKTQEARDAFAKLSAIPQLGSAQDFAAWIKADSPRWAELVRVTGAKIE